MDISSNRERSFIEWCILGDCNHIECHHCFPVINCSKKHSFCKKYGCCDEIQLF